ncbi:MAG: patatin-like phospholipase family protein [Pseudomonadota bacterium]
MPFRRLITVLLCLLVATAGSFVRAGETGPRIGLVLSGGGARGAAHVGVLKALKEMNIPVHAVAGTSMGAVVGGLYAAGMEPEALERLVTDIDWQDAFSDRSARTTRTFRRRQDDLGYLVKFDVGFNDGEIQLPKGLIQGQKLGLILREQTLPVSHIDDFDDLPTPYRAVAADLADGASIVLGAGDLVAAMRASMAAPGVFAPVEVDGRVLVDGGIAKNIPIDVGRAMGVDIVIAVDVGFPLKNVDELDSAVSVADQMLTILIRREANAQITAMRPRDVLVIPELEGYSSANFTDVATVIPTGYVAAMAVADELRALAISSAQYADFVAHRDVARRQAPAPAFVAIRGDNPLSENVLKTRLATQPGEPLDPARAAEDAGRIYGLELFEFVDYQLVEKDGRTGIEFQTTARSWGPDYLRFGLTFEEDFEGTSEFNIGARYIQNAVNRLGAEWRTDLQIGTNPRLNSEFYQPLSFDLRYFVSPQVRFEQRNVNVFSATEPFARYRATQSEFALSVGRELGNSGELRVGVAHSTGSARLQIGDEALPNLDFDRGRYFARLRRDTLDDLQFPRNGTQLDLAWSLFRPELGSDTKASLMSASWTRVRSYGRHSLAFGLDLATTESGEVSVLDFFDLGGFLSLSGLDRGQLRGPHAALARLLYYRRLGADSVGLFDWPLYIGASLESGNVWEDRDDVSLDSALVNGSGFVGMDTTFGPLFLAAGFSEDGDTSIYLFLGSPIR